MSDDSDIPRDKAGNKKPRNKGRFVPGQSGNPDGRPKKQRRAPEESMAKEPAAMFLEEAQRPLRIKEGSVVVELPSAVAVVRGLTRRAASGDVAAATLWMRHWTQAAVTLGRNPNALIYEITPDLDPNEASRRYQAFMRGEPQ